MKAKAATQQLKGKEETQKVRAMVTGGKWYWLPVTAIDTAEKRRQLQLIAIVRQKPSNPLCAILNVQTFNDCK